MAEDEPGGGQDGRSGSGRHGTSGSGRGDEPADDGAPLGDLADRLRSRRSEGATEVPGDAEGFGLDEYFEEETFEELVSDDLWATIDETPETADGVEAGEEPDEHIVPKRQYCESCEYFSEPPEVHCDHPGTSIVEFTDIDHILVRNCPVVAERRALGEADEAPMTQMSFGSQE